MARRQSKCHLDKLCTTSILFEELFSESWNHDLQFRHSGLCVVTAPSNSQYRFYSYASLLQLNINTQLNKPFIFSSPDSSIGRARGFYWDFPPNCLLVKKKKPCRSHNTDKPLEPRTPEPQKKTTQSRVRSPLRAPFCTNFLFLPKLPCPTSRYMLMLSVP